MDEKPERLTDSDKAVLALISPAQRDLLVWLRDELPWGRVLMEITVQNSEPKGTRLTKEKTEALGG